MAMCPVSMEFLGTGTSQGVPVVACECSVCTGDDPMDKRLRSSVLIKAGGAAILVDAGPDLRQQMLRSGVDRLDAVLITHEHMDHVAGIDELRAFNFRQQRAMDIHANERTLEAIKRMFHYAFSEERYPGVPELELHPIRKDLFMAAGVEITPIEVMHHFMPVLGFRIGDLAYITDAKSIGPDQLAKLSGLKVLVLNALRRKEHISHFNLAEALEMVRVIRPEQAYFTHISHLMGRHQEVAALLPDGVAIAHDGLVVDL